MRDRKPPAFQEYASDMISLREYRLMTLAERGLLYSMRLECWANQTVPSEPASLAKYLGFQPADVTAALPAVMPFFTESGAHIQSAELDAYRAKLALRDRAKSEGGKKGAAITNKKRTKSGETNE